jgi:hypothetical protein
MVRGGGGGIFQSVLSSLFLHPFPFRPFNIYFSPVAADGTVYDDIFCRVVAEDDNILRFIFVDDDLNTFIPFVVVVGVVVAVRCSNMVRACRATKEQTKQ